MTSQVPRADDTESESEDEDDKPLRVQGKAKSPSTLSELPKAKRAKAVNPVKPVKVAATWALEVDPKAPQEPQEQEQEQPEPGEPTKIGFGRKIRFAAGMSLSAMPKNEDLIFFKHATGGDVPMCYVGFKVPFKDIQPTHPTRVPKQNPTASPPLSAQPSAQSSAQSSAAPSPAKPAKPDAAPVATPVAPVALVTSAKPQAQQAQQAQLTDSSVAVRVVVFTEMEMQACDKKADPRKSVLIRIDRLMSILAPLSSSPLAVVAPSRVLAAIGAQCLPLINGGLYHIAVPVDTYPIGIDSAAALITARVRATPCLNPTGNPELPVPLAFAYTGESDYGFVEGRLSMPEPRLGCPLGYPMMSYTNPAAEPKLRVAQLAASPAYTNYTAPVGATHVAQAPAASAVHSAIVKIKKEPKIKQERDGSNAIWLL